MKNSHKAFSAALSLALLASSAAVAQPASPDDGLHIYPIPQALLYSHHNDDFTVRVRRPGGVWRDLYEFHVEVDQDTRQKATMVQFDFADGEVEVQVQKNNGNFREVEVRPGSRNIRPQVRGKLVTFRVAEPANLSVEFDGDRLHNLHILAGRPMKAPDPGPNVVVYGPGVHTPPDASGFPVKSGQTIYIAGGAVLQGIFKPTDVENVRIYGRGIIDRQKDQFTVHKSRNVEVDGLTFIYSLHGTIACSQSQDVRFSDIKTFSAGQWSDGVNIFACQDVDIDRAFIRTSDDSVAVYATRKLARGDTRNITVRRSTFWPDVAHAMFVGIHGDSVTPNVLENISFTDIDVLELDEDDPEYQGVMAISAGDTNTIRNVTFDNIRVEHIQEGRLFNFRVVYNAKYNTSPGLLVDGVRVSNVRYTGAGSPSPSWIEGLSADRPVRNIQFDNVTINGRAFDRSDPSQLIVGPHVSNVEFR